MPVSGVSDLLASRVSGLPDAKGLSAAEFKKQLLNEWLYRRFSCRLNVLYCEDVLNNLCDDLVGCLGVLGGYFYTHVYVCKTHHPWLGALLLPQNRLCRRYL